MIYPPFAGFCDLATRGNLVPVYQEILADLDTPVSAFLKVAAGQPHAFLLESVHSGEQWGRYSLIGIDPEAVVRITRDRIVIEETDQATPTVFDQTPLRHLKTFMQQYVPVPVPGLPHFHNGAVGYMGYDAVRYFERIPDQNPDPLGLPDALFIFPRTLLVFDNLSNRLKVVANAFIRPPEGEISPAEQQARLEAAYAQAQQTIARVIALLRLPLSGMMVVPPTPMQPALHATLRTEMTQEQFETAVRKAKEYIVAGDIMQVVLSQRMAIPFPHEPVTLYRALRTINPSPYMFLLRCGDFSLVGSSPEILVRQDGDHLALRPIAGTRPRGATEAEDAQLEKDLLADPKEVAEHIMLVDLGRNDLGRVATTGSVRVDERMVIERYSHVMHIVSNVTARLKPELDSFDLIASTFPAGTVSGAPKIRAMQIIDELEVSRRGPYAGAVGYISFSRQMDMAITIRTAVIKDNTLYMQAGAGIVADSQPAMEYAETINKARAMLRAVELVQHGLD